MIKSLYIDNFRCFSRFEHSPGAFELFLGENGSGKTSVFDVLEALRNVVTTGAPTEAVFPADSLCKWRENTDGSQEFRISIQGTGGDFQYQLIVDHDAKRVKNRITSEAVSLDSQPLYQFDGQSVHLFRDDGSAGPVFPFDWTRSGIATVPERGDNQLLTAFRKRMSDIYIFSPDPPAMEAVTRKAIQRPDRSLRNLASWLYAVQSDDFEIAAAVSRSLKETIAGFVKHRFQEIGSSAFELFVNFEHRDEATDKLVHQYELSFEALSEGQRNLFALYTILHAAVSPGATVCIDEPDNFVALREIQPWLSALQDQADDDDCQVFLISHHPELINQLAAHRGQMFERGEDGATTCRRFQWTDKELTTPADLVARGWE